MSELKKYTLNEFEKYINSINVSRSVRLIQLHHTYSPGYKQFTGENHIQLQTGMRNYHIKNNGWSDIGQHFTIFPDGVIVSGRSLEKIPAGIKGANTGAVCIECLGNFDKGGDIMADVQKNTIINAVKILLNRFQLKAQEAVIYHGWWSSSGAGLGDYSKTKSVKTCPGTNFFGGNTRTAFENNLLPLLEGKIKDAKKEEIEDIINRLSGAGIISDTALWIQKCTNDINVYWLCKKTADYIKRK
ncbi:MAG: N-acetylmuramoyl-L-alanine amidase [Ruminococcaceae bacterium]|nr:N-acetylmuramoyl-L-alanine amidase [Oscillospiraceae bacterium]